MATRTKTGLEASRLRGSARLMLHQIRSAADETGWAQLSVADLTAGLGVCERHVYRLIRQASNCGELVIVPGCGRANPSEYLVTAGLNLSNIATALRARLTLDPIGAAGMATQILDLQRNPVRTVILSKRVTSAPAIKTEAAPEAMPSPDSPVRVSTAGEADAAEQRVTPTPAPSVLEDPETLKEETQDSNTAGTPFRLPPEYVPPPRAPVKVVISVRETSGRMMNNPRYVYVGPDLPQYGIRASEWRARLVDVEGDVGRAQCRAMILSVPDLMAKLPNLRGRQVVVGAPNEYAWASALGDLIAELPAADSPPVASRFVEYARLTTRHVAERGALRTLCGLDVSRLEAGTGSGTLCGTCSRLQEDGPLQPHIAIIYAWHEAIPVTIRPVGSPPIEPNVVAARDIAAAGITPDQVTAFVSATSPGYVTWARKNKASPVMSLNHVKKHIRGYLDSLKKEGSGHADIQRSDGAATPPRPRGLEHIKIS